MSNNAQGMEQATKRRKGGEDQPISIGVEARAESCGGGTHKRELYAQGRK